MPRRAFVVLTLAVVFFLTGCGPTIHASFVLADSSGYRVKSPCGEGITSVKVLKGVSASEVAIYWSAEAHEESAADEIMLFKENPGYTSTHVASPLEQAGEYFVEVNGVRGTSFVPSELRPGKGAWLIDTFDSSDLPKEQKKVDSLLNCIR